MSSTPNADVRLLRAHRSSSLWLISLAITTTACSGNPLAELQAALTPPKAHAAARLPSGLPVDPDACVATSCERPAVSTLPDHEPATCETREGEGTVLWWRELGSHACILGECTASAPDIHTTGAGDLWVHSTLIDPQGDPFVEVDFGSVWTKIDAEGTPQRVHTRDRLRAVGRRTRSTGFGVGPHDLLRSVGERGGTLAAEWRVHGPGARLLTARTLVENVTHTWTELAPDGSARVLYRVDASSLEERLSANRLVAVDAQGRLMWQQTGLGDDVDYAQIAGISEDGATTLLVRTTSQFQVMRIGPDGAIEWVVQLGMGVFPSSSVATPEGATYVTLQAADTFTVSLLKLDAAGQPVWDTALPPWFNEQVHLGPGGSVVISNWGSLHGVSEDGQTCTDWQFDSEPLYAEPLPAPPGSPPLPPPSPRLFCSEAGHCNHPRLVLDGKGGLYAAGPDLVARLRLAP